MQREQLLAKEAKYQTGVVKAQEYEDLLSAIRENKEDSRIAKGINRSTWGRRISHTRRSYPSDISEPDKSRQMSLDNVNEIT